MRKALLDAISEVPSGHVVDLKTLALSLNIPARHAAYIISKLTADELERVPWHRVIPAKGDFGPSEGRTDLRLQQIESLQSEGVILKGNCHLDFDTVLQWSPDNRFKDVVWADFE